ncbi:MAG: sugar ABC transporter substrate-binding protein, partial [Blastocatellia bacterium]
MRKVYLGLALALAFALASAACVNSPSDKNAPGSKGNSGKIRIGFALASHTQERWQYDTARFEERAKELGAEVYLTSAEGDEEKEANQVDDLLTRGVDVLVIVPQNALTAASMVDRAKAQGVPVISYDRLIRNSEVDLYVSFDNVKVGELQAQYLLEHAPHGNYVLIGGAPTDNNAQMLRDGQMKVLKPAIDRGDIHVVADQWAKDWEPGEALKHTENALTQSNNNVVAVVASNDGTAGGVIQALAAQGLAGKVLVSGQDADLAGLQRVVEGKQSMTVYKPIKPLAYAAAEAAVKLARKEKIDT